jgi:hypothetical protein
MLVSGYFMHRRDLLNPITAFVGQDLILMGMVPAVLLMMISEMNGETFQNYSQVIWFHALYGVSFALAYCFSLNPLQHGIRTFLSSLSFTSLSGYGRIFGWILLMLACIFSMLFLILASPGGTLWITAPRDAYLSHRSGFGLFWMLYQMAVALLFIIAISRAERLRRPGFRMLLLIALFSGMMSLTGSKGAIITILIMAFAYRHFYVRRFETLTLIGFGVMMVIVFALLLGAQTQSSFLSILSYFSEYAIVSGLIMEVVEVQGYTLGESYTSSFWSMVPRGLYPDKPFEYGQTLLHGQLFPGMAAQGHTPGVLPWIGAYMDFGFFGVLADGIIQGSFSRAIYLEFLRTRDAGTFILMMSFCIFPPLASGSPVLYIAMTIFLWFFLGKAGRNLSCTRNLATGKVWCAAGPATVRIK